MRKIREVVRLWWDLGSVERKVATIRSRLFVPVPKADSWEELNQMLYK